MSTPRDHKEPSIEGPPFKLIGPEADMLTKWVESERRKAALECLKARIEGFDIAYDCYDYNRLNELKTSWNEELASLESNTEKEK